MDNQEHFLLNSLKSGFIDRSILSKTEYLPEILINEPSEGKKVLSTIDKELRSCEEFWISVAFVTTSGVATIINTLLYLRDRGVKGKILVSQYLNFSQPEALRRLLKFDNIELRIAVDGNFHSKGYLFKQNKFVDLIIGSSNLTANALCLNKEWNLKVTAQEESHIIFNALNLFQLEFDRSVVVDEQFITGYEKKYIEARKATAKVRELEVEEDFITPNKMQTDVLVNLERLRNEGKDKALLISATGTGKTYLSAFDVKKFNPKKFLFVVHRTNIAKAAMRSFRKVLGKNRSMGLYNGDNKELDADFIFSTIQTISKQEQLEKFATSHFDYIVIDEGHRAGADSYQRVFDYFKPKFYLGMTATPERTDGFDIFGLFDHTIAHEIRLHQAMAENMLSPFHYYGIADITIEGNALDENSDFNMLTNSERVNRIIEKSKLYGSDDGIIRGLIFCSRAKECKSLSESFNQLGLRTKSLTAENSEDERAAAITQLESDDENERLDYIFTVDIFNEGVDIPKLNQIIMLRPTESAIVFVQQLGRGLRKIDGKEYLTVIDFIGNYKNNFMVPIALYGDNSYNKDTLRKLVASGSELIPGASTVNFDEVTMKRIFEAIDNGNLQLQRDLIADYKLLKFKIGRIPMMVDFLKHNTRDPIQYVQNINWRSYYKFVATQESDFKNLLSIDQLEIISYVNSEIANAKRIEDVLLLKILVGQNSISISDFSAVLSKLISISFNKTTLASCIRNLNFEFIRKPKKLVYVENETIYITDILKSYLQNETFTKFLIDALEYSISKYMSRYKVAMFQDGFQLYEKYSRKDVCRNLNWDDNEEATVFGYRLKYNTCPIFVTYHKDDSDDGAILYPEKFISTTEFLWYSKRRKTMADATLTELRINADIRVPFFVKKHNGEGADFYYLGNVRPIPSSFRETTIKDDKGNDLSIVEIVLKLDHAVEHSLYNYLTMDDSTNSSDSSNQVSLKSAELSRSNDTEKSKLVFLKQDEIKPYLNSIPYIDVSIAAGEFEFQTYTNDCEWVKAPEGMKPEVGMFICKVVGESMNKRIPSGSLCLFKKYTGGTRDKDIVLVANREIQDADFGAGFTVKQYNSKKVVTDEFWGHSEIILKPLSIESRYKDIVLKQEEDSPFGVVGVFVQVL
jgi:superfamily II DNA or RNA helicase/HKD family nuclease